MQFLANRFTNVQLESLTGDIYGYCKDQHGCRYLQKKLEERNPQYVQMIFRETHDHVVELMTGGSIFLLYSLGCLFAKIIYDRSLWKLSLSKVA